MNDKKARLISKLQQLIAEVKAFQPDKRFAPDMDSSFETYCFEGWAEWRLQELFHQFRQNMIPRSIV